MSLFQGDIVIKTAIELGIEDMRKNPWLIDDMLSDLVTISYYSGKYGQKQIDACKEWFANNSVSVFMRKRNDQDDLPCVTVEIGSSSEKRDMKSMGDASTEKVVLMPSQIKKPIPYVVKPFTPTAYDSTSGELNFDQSLDGVSGIAPGMILVNPSNGTGYTIEDVSPLGITIATNLTFNLSQQYGIVPKYQYYEARVEHTFMNETYNIGCHAHGDPQTLLWLWSIVLYSLLRYRESLLEACGFAESSVDSSNPDLNSEFTTQGGEEAWSRYITLSGQVENSWVKTPRRFIESAVLKEKAPNGVNSSTGYLGGIKIISNEDSPAYIDQSQETWTTVDESDEE